LGVVALVAGVVISPVSGSTANTWMREPVVSTA
jgi:hypothetical protein